MTRRFHWLLWLMLALLPLRGWAFAAMTMPAAGPVEVAAATQSLSPPCHEQASPHGDASGDTGHRCALCVICHSAVAPAAALALTAAAPIPAALPMWRADRRADAERQALFKPPRD